LHFLTKTAHQWTEPC